MKTLISQHRNHHSLELALPGLLLWSNICTFPIGNCCSLSVEVSGGAIYFGVPHCSLTLFFLYILYILSFVCTKDNLLLCPDFRDLPACETWRWQRWYFSFYLFSQGMKGFPNRTFSWKTHGLMQLNIWMLNIVLESDFINFHKCYKPRNSTRTKIISYLYYFYLCHYYLKFCKHFLIQGMLYSCYRYLGRILSTNIYINWYISLFNYLKAFNNCFCAWNRQFSNYY